VKQSDAEQVLRDGLLQGVKDHVAKITSTIIGDAGTTSVTDEVTRFATGLKASRAFYEAALTEIKKDFGEIQP
jgi:hypothetical protein